MSLTSSLLALSPLSSFSTSLSADQDPISEREESPIAQVDYLPKPVDPFCINDDRPWGCLQCGSSLVPLSLSSQLYLFSVPMRPNTCSQNPPSSAPDPTPPPRRTTTARKRKASNPLAEDPATAPAPATARKGKKKRTNEPSAPTEPAASPATAAPTQQVVAQAPPAAPVDHAAHPVPTPPDGGGPSWSMVIDPSVSLAPPADTVPLAQPIPPLSMPIPPLSAPLQPLDDPFLPPDDPRPSDVEPAGPNETGPGEATRNRGQRAPTLREQNAALVKANTELEGEYGLTCYITSLNSFFAAKVKQLNADLRVVKKYKVMWVKEYSKKAKSGTAPPESLIPRPPGEKGKNGWNLQEAMGLEDDDALYIEILVRLSILTLHIDTHELAASLSELPDIASVGQVLTGRPLILSKNRVVSLHVSKRLVNSLYDILCRY